MITTNGLVVYELSPCQVVVSVGINNFNKLTTFSLLKVINYEGVP